MWIEWLPPQDCFKGYLYQCYAFYVCKRRLVPDIRFNELCEHLVKVWDKIDHPMQQFVSISDLQQHLGRGLLGQWPEGFNTRYNVYLARYHGITAPDQRVIPARDQAKKALKRHRQRLQKLRTARAARLRRKQ